MGWLGSTPFMDGSRISYWIGGSDMTQIHIWSAMWQLHPNLIHIHKVGLFADWIVDQIAVQTASGWLVDCLQIVQIVHIACRLCRLLVDCAYCLQIVWIVWIAHGLLVDWWQRQLDWRLICNLADWIIPSSTSTNHVQIRLDCRLQILLRNPRWQQLWRDPWKYHQHQQ